MAKLCAWLTGIAILAACTCGVRTECPSHAQVSLLTGVHDDPACQKVSTKGVLLYEAAKFLADAHNNKTNGYKIGKTVLTRGMFELNKKVHYAIFGISELAVFDTCGTIAGAVKAAMKGLVWADMNCLQPPHYLGIHCRTTMMSDGFQKRPGKKCKFWVHSFRNNRSRYSDEC